MVIIHLTDLEAFRFSEMLEKISNNIERQALREGRPVNSIENLQICACCEIFSQTSEQLPEGTHADIVIKQDKYNREFREEQDDQAKNN